MILKATKEWIMAVCPKGAEVGVKKISSKTNTVHYILPYSKLVFECIIEGETFEEQKYDFCGQVNEQLDIMINHLGDVMLNEEQSI